MQYNKKHYLCNMKINHLIILLFALIILQGCGGKNRTSDRPTLTVTLEPLRYFTEAIAGDRYNVVSMVPEGNSPETYDPTPQQMVALTKSTAYLRIGYIGFEQNWMDKLKSNAPHLRIFDTSQGVSLIREETFEHGDHHHPGGVEPHIWNSPRNASIIATNIYHALCDIDSGNRAYYKQRLDSLSLIIERTDQKIRSLLSTADSTFLIYHPALSYYARDYGLTQISIEEGGKEPSPTRLQELIEKCRRANVQTIFVQQEFDTHNAESIARELKLNIIRINPLNYHWEEEMIRIAGALNKKKQS